MSLSFNPRSSAFRANPYPTYHELRMHHPIYYRAERQDWVLTRYADIIDVLKHPSFGRSERGLESLQTANQEPASRFLSMRQESQKLMTLWLVLRNPPVHTRLRHVLRKVFTQSRIQALQTYLQAEVDDLIERAQKQGKMDIIGDLAYPLTLGLNCKILGIPPQAWHPCFNQWSQDLSLVADMDVTPIANERGLLAIAGLAEYFKSWIAARHTPSQGQDSLIETLIQAESEGQLSEEERLATCIFMFAVGHASTANLLGTGMLTLLNHPEQLRLLQSDPSFIDMTIAEMLRYESPVQGISRTALADVELCHQTIHQGEIVHCLIAAANRDPAKFPNPDIFDIRRHPNPYLSFGQGIHTCIGRHLAALVARIAVGTLVRRLPKLALTTASLEWEEAFLGRGLKALPVVF
ncbi:cytochrome P450 [Candidatus Entotheonella palauensis]|uniref:Cytochrome P450 n=1 Tax=Candidatus Entotheonella gemina TaxID=1429439 RepID=W4M4C0_9BACT|nr:cytochrome P450 [Candidatus Entotheonella palauensis]ETX05040.1 MAG: hypothetical protein ETSY2_25305 [Candidatus Entotheonella gemina]